MTNLTIQYENKTISVKVYENGSEKFQLIRNETERVEHHRVIRNTIGVVIGITMYEVRRFTNVFTEDNQLVSLHNAMKDFINFRTY